MNELELTLKQLKDLVKEGLSVNAILRHCSKNGIDAKKEEVQKAIENLEIEEILKSLSKKGKGGELCI
jgi:hypothetical protein